MPSAEEMDDAALAASRHLRADDLGAEESAGEVDVDDALEIRLGSFRDGLEQQHAGVGNINLAERCLVLAMRLFQLSSLGDIVC